ncbi:hypothetical protein [Propionibacterium freudenreichii]|uniref:hypothetical protein n=1 Tax=Propionibacterium freudenreichii TaxID=1744 RepID=UPI0021A4637E|nr:hypothetical protein [Propionibacterium freudenreichii]MCT2983701.1 hypothetical protein [Propionibacterium freudenreichii]
MELLSLIRNLPPSARIEQALNPDAPRLPDQTTLLAMLIDELRDFKHLFALANSDPDSRDAIPAPSFLVMKTEDPDVIDDADTFVSELNAIAAA